MLANRKISSNNNIRGIFHKTKVVAHSVIENSKNLRQI